GDLAGGIFDSEGRKVSADGSIVAGTGVNGNPVNGSPFGGFQSESFRWTAQGGLQGLGNSIGARANSAIGISGDGSVIVGSFMDTYPIGRPYVWTSTDGLRQLDGITEGDATGASFNGSVVVGRMATSSGYRAYRWTQATGPVNLGVLPGGGESDGYGVSSDGSVIVGASDTSNGFQAFRW